MTKTNPIVYIAALAPATYFGLHNYDFVHRQAVDIGAGDIVATTLGVVAGVAAAFVLELAGVKAGTLMFQQQGGKRAVSVVLFLTYLTTAIATVVAVLPASVATIIIAVLYYLANGIEEQTAENHADEVARISAELAKANGKNADLVTELQQEKDTNQKDFENDVEDLKKSIDRKDAANLELQQRLQKAQNKLQDIKKEQQHHAMLMKNVSPQGEQFIVSVLSGEMTTTQFAKQYGVSASYASGAKKVLNGVAK